MMLMKNSLLSRADPELTIASTKFAAVPALLHLH
jgi:hypothetical protein